MNRTYAQLTHTKQLITVFSLSWYVAIIQSPNMTGWDKFQSWAVHKLGSLPTLKGFGSAVPVCKDLCSNIFIYVTDLCKTTKHLHAYLDTNKYYFLAVWGSWNCPCQQKFHQTFACWGMVTCSSLSEKKCVTRTANAQVIHVHVQNYKNHVSCVS